jgi:PAS domain S-box-containing protein
MREQVEIAEPTDYLDLAAGEKGYPRAVLDHAADAIIAITREGKIRSFNRTAEQMFNYRAADVINRNADILLPDASYSTWNLIDPAPSQFDVRQRQPPGLSARRADGSLFPVEVSTSEINLSGEHILVAFVRDITARRRTEQALQDHASYLSAVMKTVAEGLITYDERGTISSFNPAAERIFDYTETEVIGQNIKLLISEPYGSGAQEISARRRDGTVFSMHLAVSETILHDRRLYVGIFRDITDRKEAETDRLNLIANLKQSNQELDDFACIVAHDLKEPLRGVANNAIFFREDYENVIDEAAGKRLNRICFLCKRMETLIDDLLYFARLGRQELAYRETDLNGVVRDIIEELENTPGQQSVSVRVCEPLPSLVCDATRLGEVFRNLIANAIKYNDKQEKVVEIGCNGEDNGERNVMYVKDNGIGIPAEFRSDVFTIFKRLKSEDDNARGSGVGLTFAKKIVERHGGRIWLESEIGQGTTFFFELGRTEV